MNRVQGNKLYKLQLHDYELNEIKALIISGYISQRYVHILTLHWMLNC